MTSSRTIGKSFLNGVFPPVTQSNIELIQPDRRSRRLQIFGELQASSESSLE